MVKVKGFFSNSYKTYQNTITWIQTECKCFAQKAWCVQKRAEACV